MEQDEWKRRILEDFKKKKEKEALNGRNSFFCAPFKES